jgi:CheY-like chemotaxis protein
MGRQDRFPSDALVGVHVLVVDDDADAREIVQTVLHYCGALVTQAASASEALRVLGRVTPDVVVSDIAMPDRDGYWLLRQLRALPSTERLPVVAITAHGELHRPERTLDAGFQAHVRKPIDPWELCRVLVSVTRRE